YSLRHRHRPWVSNQRLIAVSFLGDAVVVCLALIVAYVIRFETGIREFGVMADNIDAGSYAGHVIIGSLLLMFLLANFRLHDPRNFLALRKSGVIIVKSCMIWCAAFLAIALVLKIDPAISRIYCVIGAVTSMAMLLFWRWFLHGIVRGRGFIEKLQQKAIFVGWNEECERAVKRSQAGRIQPISICGMITAPGANASQVPDDVAKLGKYENFRSILRSTGADLVMVVDGVLERNEMLKLAETCGKEFVDFKIVPNCFQILVSGLHLENFHGMPVLGVGKLPLHHAFNNAFKRIVDIVGGIFGLIVFAPVMAFFMAWVYFESPGPVIYRQRRIGLNGKPFDILKIRSMKLNAEAPGKVGWTVKDDPRRLRIGSRMRSWNVDELPQFWNVIMGDMSLVGPRPERPELIEDFKEDIPHYNVRHNIKPGLTGWAQVNGLRGDTCLRERVKFDLDYIENWNFLLDFQIMVMTLLSRRGAC
ncbi:MAG TPA: sugar transferase, partial [Luteolibacter sp.]|nr:sugar transferase [Luteolibacter sp.]